MNRHYSQECNNLIFFSAVNSTSLPLMTSKEKLRKWQLTAQHQPDYGSQPTCNTGKKEFTIQLYISAAPPTLMQTRAALLLFQKD